MNMSHVQPLRSLRVLLPAVACLLAIAPGPLSCTPAPSPETSPTLFVAGAWGSNVVSFADAATLDGDVTPTTNLLGDETGILGPTGIAVDEAGDLVVANILGNSITFYRNATTVNGNIPPDRTVQGLHTGLGENGTGGPAGMALDRASDVIYVSRNLNTLPSILVFAQASTIDGDATPTHMFHSAAMTNPGKLCLDRLGNLYVANTPASDPTDGSAIFVFANPASLQGDVAPTRTIRANPAFDTGVMDLCIDASDRLYVLNESRARIDIFENASSLHGTFPPHASLIPPLGAAANLPTCIVVDSHGRGYIGTGWGVYCCDDIASLNGDFAPTRTIAGPSTQLLVPGRLFLLD
jgi:hypothetical protein